MGLPQGLSIDASSGVISGTIAESAAVNGLPTDYTFTVQGRTSSGAIARKTDTIRVYPRPVVTLTTPAGTVGVAYTGSVNVTNQASTPRAYTVPSGALPTSLSLNSSTGAITGTPSVAGIFTGVFRVTANFGVVRDTAFSITIA